MRCLRYALPCPRYALRYALRYAHVARAAAALRSRCLYALPPRTYARCTRVTCVLYVWSCACYALFAGTTFAIGALAAAAALAAATVLPALVSNLALGCLLRCPPLSPLRQAARPGPGEGAPAPQTTASHLCCGRPRYACVIHCTRVTLHATSALRPHKENNPRNTGCYRGHPRNIFNRVKLQSPIFAYRCITYGRS